MMEPKDWIAVAQVYATLAVAHTSLHLDGSTDPEDDEKAIQYIERAKSALRIAGVKDA